MIPNLCLSIVIPTYNRADFLDYSLEVHIPLARAYNVQIYISDNASTDSTKKIVEKWQKEYPLLHYFCNECNVGEINFEIALKLPKTDYVWLLGDTYRLPEEGIKYLFMLTENKKYDAIVVNLAKQINVVTRDYDDSNLLLNNLGALMTCLSCLVYSHDLIKRANFSRYYNSYFVQTGIIFEDICTHNFSIYWIQDMSITELNHPLLQKTNWSSGSKALEIGCEKWANFIFSLPPSYDIQNKLKCIMDFGKISELFTLRGLLLRRALGVVTIKSLYKCHNLLSLTVDFPKIFIYGLGLIPKSIVKIMIFMALVLFKRSGLKLFKAVFSKEN